MLYAPIDDTEYDETEDMLDALQQDLERDIAQTSTNDSSDTQDQEVDQETLNNRTASIFGAQPMQGTIDDFQDDIFEPLDDEVIVDDYDTVLEQETVDLSNYVPKEDYETLQNRLDTLMSDWENFRRRSATEIEAAKASANLNLMEALVPTLDHFAFALDSVDTTALDPSTASFLKGFDAIYRSLQSQLSREGLEVINPAVGTQLDLSVHQAVERVETDDPTIGSGSVAGVIQVGYKFGGKVIRPALVRVAG
jgi:molecular chaperone GrpE